MIRKMKPPKPQKPSARSIAHTLAHLRRRTRNEEGKIIRTDDKTRDMQTEYFSNALLWCKDVNYIKCLLG